MSLQGWNRIQAGPRWYRISTFLSCVLLAAYCVGSGSGEAAQPSPFLDDEPGGSRAYREPERWIEDLAEPPQFPDASILLEFDLSVPDPQFRYLIAPESLAIGDDGVVRYVVVVEARSGTARNLLFEGMNCATEEYKSYAFGSPGGEWRRPRRAAAWQRIRNDIAGIFRYDLRRLYFCNLGEGRPWPLDQILHRIRTSPGFKQNTFLEDF